MVYSYTLYTKHRSVADKQCNGLQNREINFSMRARYPPDLQQNKVSVKVDIARRKPHKLEHIGANPITGIKIQVEV